MTAIKGLDGLMRKLDALGGNTREAVKAGMLQGVKQVQGDAKLLCPVDDGRLRNSILGEVREENDKIVGVISTNVEYAPYVEFGTGPVGRATADLPPDLAGKIQYRADGWWIHESQIDQAVAEKYRFRRMETANGVFYYTRGQPAQPFLYPAIRQNENLVQERIAEQLKAEIERLAKG